MSTRGRKFEIENGGHGLQLEHSFIYHKFWKTQQMLFLELLSILINIEAKWLILIAAEIKFIKGLSVNI